MNIFLVHAHQEDKSFCSALKNIAITKFKESGHSIVVSDLYKMSFNPVATKNDFSKLSNLDFFKYKTEQLHASQNGLFVREIFDEIQKLLDADIVVFTFPLWWNSFPAIMKGWIDKVFAHGTAYMEEENIKARGKLTSKKALIVMTAGASDSEEIKNCLSSIENGILKVVGFNILPSFVANRPNTISHNERLKILTDFQSHLSMFI